MTSYPEMRIDKNGMRWVCIGPAQNKDDYGNEFGSDRSEPMPSREPLTTGATAYADACSIGPCLDAIWRRVLRDNFPALLARAFVYSVKESGGNFRVEGCRLILRGIYPSTAEKEVIAEIKPYIIQVISEQQQT